jgi:octaprenyl-diphosphate synthase
MRENVNIASEIKTKPSSPIEKLLVLAADDMKHVDAIIQDRMQSPVGMIPDLAQHLISAGGKRLRPLLTIACAHLCDYQGDQQYKLAAAVEFIHSATLLHDDVVDMSAKRRGKKTANLIFGNAPSILVGDFLFARAFNLMVETGSMDALNILSSASSTIAEGEVRQLAALNDINMREEDYLQVICAKTAALFAAATEVAPVIAGMNDHRRTALRDYGLELGMAFQLVDDALDYGGLESNLGKSVGDDFREGKMTLPVIHAYQKAQDADDLDAIIFWKRVIVDHHQGEHDLDHALSLLQDAGSLNATLDKARGYVKSAVGQLSHFPDSAWKTSLIELANFVVDRVS